MGASVGWAVLSIVAEKMTSKALRQGTGGSRPKGVRVREYTSGGGEYAHAVREVDVLSHISRDRESPIVRIS